MPLIHSELSLWEVAFRWSGRDPSGIWLRIPLDVRDHFRNLMLAILREELVCDNLSTKKWHSGCGSDPEFFIRHYIDEVYACVYGVKFDRKLLKWAQIDRSDLKKWCRRRGIPLPDFWFPPGSKDFPFEEQQLEVDLTHELKELEAQYRSAFSAYFDDPIKAASSENPADSPELKKLGQEINQLEFKLEHLEEHGKLPEEGEVIEKKLRVNQRVRVAAQVVAEKLWKEHPQMLIADMLKHEFVRKACGAGYFSDEVVRRWLSEVAPPEVSARVGRPRKKNPTEELS